MIEMKTLTIDGNTYEIVDETARDSIPTKTSELENDSGFITAEDIPETPAISDEQINSAVETYLADKQIQGGLNLTDTEKLLILTLLEKAVYTEDVSGTIKQLKELWTGENNPEDEPQEITVEWQNGAYMGGGEEVSLDTRLRSTILPDVVNEISCDEEYEFAVICFDDNGKTPYNNNDNIAGSAFINFNTNAMMLAEDTDTAKLFTNYCDLSLIRPNVDKYDNFRVVLRNVDTTTVLTLADAENITFS